MESKMSLFTVVSKLVNTLDIRDSAVETLKGWNVRYYKLQPGKMYLMRERGRKISEYFNTYSLVRFKGVGTTEELAGNLPNLRLRDLGAQNAVYVFEGVDSAGEVYQFSAYAFEGKLCVGTGATSVSLYAVKE
jgi:hypothetical protein